MHPFGRAEPPRVGGFGPGRNVGGDGLARVSPAMGTAMATMTDKRSTTATDLALLLALATLWGASYTFIRIGVETIPPITFIAARTVIAGGLLLAVIRVRRIAVPGFFGGQSLGLLLRRAQRRLLLVLGGLFRQAPRMRVDDLPAACHCSLRPFPGLRRRLWLERLPLSFELPQGCGVQDVVNSVTVPFERCAQGVDSALFLRNALRLGAQRIALLLDALVDALVLAA